MGGKPADRSDEPRKVVDLRAEPDDDGQVTADDGRYDHVSLPSNLPPMNALTTSKWEPDEAVSESPQLEAIPEVRVLDPRLEELETMIGRGDWAAIADKLGPFGAPARDARRRRRGRLGSAPRAALLASAWREPGEVRRGKAIRAPCA